MMAPRIDVRDMRHYAGRGRSDTIRFTVTSTDEPECTLEITCESGAVFHCHDPESGSELHMVHLDPDTLRDLCHRLLAVDFPVRKEPTL